MSSVWNKTKSDNYTVEHEYNKEGYMCITNEFYDPYPAYTTSYLLKDSKIEELDTCLRKYTSIARRFFLGNLFRGLI